MNPQQTPISFVQASNSPATMSLSQLKAWVLQRVMDAGFSPFTALQVIQCESGWNPTPNPHKDSNGTVDYGLWQLNSVHKLSVAEMEDPFFSTDWVIKNLLPNWENWTCYNLQAGTKHSDTS